MASQSRGQNHKIGQKDFGSLVMRSGTVHHRIRKVGPAVALLFVKIGTAAKVPDSTERVVVDLDVDHSEATHDCLDDGCFFSADRTDYTPSPKVQSFLQQSGMVFDCEIMCAVRQAARWHCTRDGRSICCTPVADNDIHVVRRLQYLHGEITEPSIRRLKKPDVFLNDSAVAYWPNVVLYMNPDENDPIQVNEHEREATREIVLLVHPQATVPLSQEYRRAWHFPHPRDDQKEVSFALLPVCRDAHWWLIVLLRSGVVAIMDSLDTPLLRRKEDARGLAIAFHDAWTKHYEAPFFPVRDDGAPSLCYSTLDVPHQPDASSCGVYLVENASRFIVGSTNLKDRIRKATSERKELPKHTRPDLRDVHLNVLFEHVAHETRGEVQDQNDSPLLHQYNHQEVLYRRQSMIDWFERNASEFYSTCEATSTSQ